MYKTTLHLALLIFILSPLAARCQLPENKSASRLIHAITEERAAVSLINGEWVPQQKSETDIKVYDRNGEVIEAINRISDGRTSSHTKSLDSDNNPRQKKSALLDKDGNITVIYETITDESGIVTQRRNLKPDGTVIRDFLYFYDDDKNPTRELFKDESGETIGAKIYEYDDENRLTQVKQVSYQTNDVLTIYEDYEYDGEKTIITRTSTSMSPFKKIVRIEYPDADGNKVTENWFYGLDTSPPTQTKEKKSSTQTSSANKVDPPLHRKVIYVTNQAGDMISYLDESGGNKTRSEYTYIYDESGNWIEKREI